jgi:hypothetical protein
MLSYANGSIVGSSVSNNMLRSEHIADYSYEKFSNYTLEDIVKKYGNLLDRYQKKSFVE